MADLLRFEIKNPVAKLFDQFPRNVQEAINKTVRETSDLLFERIKLDTPRDRGLGGGAVSRWKKVDVPGTNGAASSVISNDAPHINVLEFGGFPVIPASRTRPNATGPGLPRGRAVLGGYPPGPRTAAASGGSPTMNPNVSRQAPRGMVRQNVERIQERFVFDLGEAIDVAFNEGAG